MAASMALWTTILMGCAGSFGPSGAEPDGGLADALPPDGGALGWGEWTDSPPAQVLRSTVQLGVQAIWWHQLGELRVTVRLANRGPGAVPAGRDAFGLATSEGVVVTASAVDDGGCPERARLAAGQHMECTLAFQTRLQPVAILHPSTRLTLRACGPTHPGGLCGLREGCVEGRCRDLCSLAHQDGVCLEAGAVCDRGACVARCSPDDPAGGCEEGVCRDGACTLECRSLARQDAECEVCLWEAIEWGRCTIEERCEECGGCPGSVVDLDGPRRTCECLSEPICEGCGAAGRAYFDCLAEVCPMCPE